MSLDIPSDVLVVVVEGNISSGKTSIMERLASLGYLCFPENITEMTPFLEEMYNGKERQSDGLQMRIVVDQIQHRNEILKRASSMKKMRNGKKVVFLERWIGASEHVFIKSASEAEHITITPKGVKMWYDLVEASGLSAMRVDAYVYIRSNPETAHSRIVRRSSLRTSERAVSLEYIETLHSLYEAFVQKLDVVIPITNEGKSKDEFVRQSCEHILEEIGAL